MSRIILAEDDDTTRLLIMGILTEEGYSVSCVDNGLDLMRLIHHTFNFDLIITDIVMPKGEGDDLLHILKEQGCATPAIIITAQSECIPPEGVKVVFKPIDRDELLGVIKSLLGGK